MPFDVYVFVCMIVGRVQTTEYFNSKSVNLLFITTLFKPN